ncbi:MAG: RDD family protein [Dehalococcoidia bacterium]
MVKHRVANLPGQVDLRYASFETRLVAFVLDLVVLFSVFLLFIAAAGLQLLLRSDFGDVDPPDAAYDLAAIILMAYLIFLPAYFLLLWAWRGQTVGQMAMAIKVMRRDGRPIGLARAAIRMGGLNFLPPVFFLSLFSLPSAGTSEDALVALILVLGLVGLVLIAVQVLGFPSVLFDRQRRALHDRLADTIVVEPK